MHRLPGDNSNLSVKGELPHCLIQPRQHALVEHLGFPSNVTRSSDGWRGLALIDMKSGSIKAAIVGREWDFVVSNLPQHFGV